MGKSSQPFRRPDWLTLHAGSGTILVWKVGRST